MKVLKNQCKSFVLSGFVDEKSFTNSKKHCTILLEIFLSIIFSKKFYLKNFQKRFNKFINQKVGESICMINFTKRYVNTVSFIISIIIFCFLNNNFLSILKINSKNFFIFDQLVPIIQESQNIIKKCDDKENKNIVNEEPAKDESLLIQEDTKDELKQTVNWQVEIPKIDLKAVIQEGTTKEIMDEFVGHFEETSKDIGNIALAAHNRGYKVNYFQGLKKLKAGDEIFYTYNSIKRKYVVETHKIIKDTDWSLLENTEDNRITLITCVENEPEYRRCIQAIECIEK